MINEENISFIILGLILVLMTILCLCIVILIDNNSDYQEAERIVYRDINENIYNKEKIYITIKEIPNTKNEKYKPVKDIPNHNINKIKKVSPGLLTSESYELTIKKDMDELIREVNRYVGLKLGYENVGVGFNGKYCVNGYSLGIFFDEEEDIYYGGLLTIITFNYGFEWKNPELTKKIQEYLVKMYIK